MRPLLLSLALIPTLTIAWESPEIRPQTGQVVRVEMLAWIKLGDQWTEEWIEVRTITYTGQWPTGTGYIGEKVLRWRLGDCIVSPVQSRTSINREVSQHAGRKD